MVFKLRIVLLLMVMMCFVNGCAQNNYREKAYEDLKEYVLNEDYSGVGYILFFETETKNEITYTDAFSLQRDLYYSPKYKDIDKDAFLKKIMMGEIILSCKDFRQCFTIVPTIMEDYKKKNFEDFLKSNTRYLEEDNKYIINYTYSYNEKISVAYYLYLNNFYSSYDDYSFDFFSRKDPVYNEVITDTEGWEILEE